MAPCDSAMWRYHLSSGQSITDTTRLLTADPPFTTPEVLSISVAAALYPRAIASAVFGLPERPGRST